MRHENPQEVGDFAILHEGGYQPRRPLMLNGLSSLATVQTAVLAFLWLDQVGSLDFNNTYFSPKESLRMRKDNAALRNVLILGGTIIVLAIVGILIVNYVA